MSELTKLGFPKDGYFFIINFQGGNFTHAGHDNDDIVDYYGGGKEIPLQSFPPKNFPGVSLHTGSNPAVGK